MSDDLDDLLHRAMKTLDDQVPSGYFEDLPNRTLARLEESIMQSTGLEDRTGTVRNNDRTGNDREGSSPSAVANASTSVRMTAASGSGIPQRDEDSGLHDIKNLASSQRMRLSRRSTQNPIIPDDDVLASSSAGWKAVALPEPARMVSLPELAELPTKAEVKAREKAQKAAARESKKDIVAAAATPASSPAIEAPAAVPVSAPVATAVAPAAPLAAPATVTPIGARAAAKKPGGSTKILAIAGIGLAAAAGITIFVMTQKGDKNAKQDRAATAESSSVEKSAPAAAMEDKSRGAEKKTDGDDKAAQIATDEKKDAAKEEAAATGSAAALAPSDAGSAAPPAPQPKLDPKPTPPKKAATEVKPDKKDKVKEPEAPKTPDKPTGPATVKTPDEGKKTVGKGKPGEPDFDQLLKEAGVKEKADAPKIEKKQLSMGEFKTAMAGITGVAQKCFAGTAGTALVRVAIAPSGKISSVQVTGAFAGTPVGTCVENAVRGLTFPPWDGPPQSFGYSYLLAE